jgi:hypothetical protein
MNHSLTERPDMYKPFTIVAAVTALSMAAFAAIAYDPPPDSISQGGDPARWYRPADTPEKLYQTHVKEAKAALKEALADCRSGARTDRRACASDAMQTYREDMEAAKNQRMGRDS